MRRFLKSIKGALIRAHLLKFQGELPKTMRVDGDITDLRERRERTEKLETASRNTNSDDAGFLMEFLTAKLSSPFGSECFFCGAQSGREI